MRRVLVSGSSGFIGHHLVKDLVRRGYWVRGVDRKRPEFEQSPAHEFWLVDLMKYRHCMQVFDGIDDVFHLACEMGGIGFISQYHARVSRDISRVDGNMLEAAVSQRVSRFFFSSSACVYDLGKQQQADVTALCETDAWPAQPEEGYGLAKIFTEKMCEYYSQEHGLTTRIARFHNVMGSLGTYTGGREKAPAALCRKVATAKDGDSIEIWGDGAQTRSFMYIDDCVEGIHRIMESDCPDPLNLGTSHLVTIRELAEMIVKISGKRLYLQFDPAKPRGVQGRNSDNTRIKQVLGGWEPSYPLWDGLNVTYAWIESQIKGGK